MGLAWAQKSYTQKPEVRLKIWEKDTKRSALAARIDRQLRVPDVNVCVMRVFPFQVSIKCILFRVGSGFVTFCNDKLIISFHDARHSKWEAVPSEQFTIVSDIFSLDVSVTLKVYMSVSKFNIFVIVYAMCL